MMRIRLIGGQAATPQRTWSLCWCGFIISLWLHPLFWTIAGWRAFLIRNMCNSSQDLWLGPIAPLAREEWEELREMSLCNGQNPHKPDYRTWARQMLVCVQCMLLSFFPHSTTMKFLVLFFSPSRIGLQRIDTHRCALKPEAQPAPDASMGWTVSLGWLPLDLGRKKGVSKAAFLLEQFRLTSCPCFSVQ